MKLILVPGMDGTGQLFKEFVSYLDDMDYQIIPLPNDGDQSYQALTRYILERLPKNESFSLLVESFSGPIGLLIAQTKPVYLRQLIVVASFTQPLFLAKIPLSGLAVNYAHYMPLVSYTLLYGRGPWVAELKRVIESLPRGLLAERIKSIAGLRLVAVAEPVDIPVIYIRPSSDYLVSHKQANQWLRFVSCIEYLDVNGPHFILQANPRDCAKAILQTRNKQ